MITAWIHLLGWIIVGVVIVGIVKRCTIVTLFPTPSVVDHGVRIFTVVSQREELLRGQLHPLDRSRGQAVVNHREDGTLDDVGQHGKGSVVGGEVLEGWNPNNRLTLNDRCGEQFTGGNQGCDGREVERYEFSRFVRRIFNLTESFLDVEFDFLLLVDFLHHLKDFGCHLHRVVESDRGRIFSVVVDLFVVFFLLVTLL